MNRFERIELILTIAITLLIAGEFGFNVWAHYETKEVICRSFK